MTGRVVRRRVVASLAGCAVAVASSGCAGSGTSTRSIPSGPVITVSGTRYVGRPTTTAYALTDFHRPRQLTVYGEVEGYCVGEPRPVVRATTTETDSEVGVAAGRYQPPSPGGACAGVGLEPVPYTLMLRSPLGGRPVRDRRTGRTVPVLDLAAVPRPTSVPAGYTAEPYAWSPSGGGYGTLSRFYRRDAQSYLTFAVSATVVAGLAADDHLLGRAEVHGRQASVYREPDQGPLLVLWTTASGAVARVSANRLSSAELLVVARGVA